MACNKDYLVVFSPREAWRYRYKRFLISVNRLPVYVGAKNALEARRRADTSKTDKVTIKLRKFGKLEIYVK